MKKQDKKKQAQLPLRLNILFFCSFLLFSLLILQLGVVQILNGESFQAEIDETVEEVTKEPVPRGKIFDRNHEVLVDNDALYAITYTPPKGVQPEDKLKLAKDLSKYMSMDIYDDNGELTGITDRMKREYWYLENRDKAENLLTLEEKEDMEDDEVYDEILQKIPDDEIDNLTDEDLEIIAIKKELDKAYSLTPQIIKNEDISLEEYARIGEHLDELPGINVTTDWDRKYPNKSTFNAFLGSITSQDQGILADQEDYYITRGYSRNDRVGRSGLEQQYEDVLRGRKEQIEYVTDKNGAVIDTNILVPGERGKDLVLTIDLEYQKKVDEIVQKELKNAIEEHPRANKYLEEALVVVMNPKTGELLAVSGQHYDRDKKEFDSSAIKALYDAHRPGSVVKGATVLTGLQSEVITPDQVFNDRPIKIAQTPEKGSWRNLGSVNDIDAIEQSSNVYMYFIAMRMGGVFHYERNMPLKVSVDTFQTMRNYFRQFGLGSETRVDFPYEETGFVGTPTEGAGGLLMDYAIGQYDTYTTLQLAQYVSTIANDGYRVRPHFVKEIRNPSPYEDELGSIYQEFPPETLNKIEMDEEYIERVQEGFRRVFQGSHGTARQYFHDRDYDPAGKTGTAEEERYEDGEVTSVQNLSLIGYAPFEDPEVAFAIVVPGLGDISGQYPINNLIGQQILDAYFDMKDDK